MEAAPLAPHYDDADLVDEPEDLSKHTAIQNRYCFWYRQRSVKGGGAGSGGGDDKNTWKEPESVASFQTVQHFWRIYDHLMRPSACPAITDFHLFKHGIKPTWEDPSNRNGGQFIIRMKKGLSSRCWEALLLAIIGEQFDVGNEICGAVISIRYNEDIVALWNRNADNIEAQNKIRHHMTSILGIPPFVSPEYKQHAQSMTDKSSFRNTTVWRGGEDGGSGNSRGRSDSGDQNERGGRHDRHGERGERHGGRGGGLANDAWGRRGGGFRDTEDGQTSGRHYQHSGKREWSKDWNGGQSSGDGGGAGTGAVGSSGGGGGGGGGGGNRDLNSKWR